MKTSRVYNDLKLAVTSMQSHGRGICASVFYACAYKQSVVVSLCVKFNRASSKMHVPFNSKEVVKVDHMKCGINFGVQNLNCKDLSSVVIGMVCRLTVKIRRNI